MWHDISLNHLMYGKLNVNPAISVNSSGRLHLIFFITWEKMSTCNKWRKKIPRSRNSSKIQWKIVERDEIYTPYIQIHERSSSCLVKSGGVKLVAWPYTCKVCRKTSFTYHFRSLGTKFNYWLSKKQFFFIYISWKTCIFLNL